MNSNPIREVESLYNLTQDFLSDDGLEEKQQSWDLNRPEYRDPLPKAPERYFQKDQLMCMFKAL